MTSNPFILAADNPTALLTLLRSQPGLAKEQDETGYSLIHAAASYNRTELCKNLVQEFHVDVNIKDSDGESALFVTETVEMAQLLVEELGADFNLKNNDGQTAAEKMESEEENPLVTAYLRAKEATEVDGTELQLPGDMKVTFTTADEPDADLPVDEEFKRRIEELAQRPDFETSGQEELRALVEDAVRGKILEQNTTEEDRRKRT